jgi:hypothetical protein
MLKLTPSLRLPLSCCCCGCASRVVADAVAALPQSLSLQKQLLLHVHTAQSLMLMSLMSPRSKRSKSSTSQTPTLLLHSCRTMRPMTPGRRDDAAAKLHNVGCCDRDRR